jgi:hypothetical protein
MNIMGDFVIDERSQQMQSIQRQNRLMMAVERYNEAGMGIMWYDIYNNNNIEPLPAPNRFHRRRGRPLGPRCFFNESEPDGPTRNTYEYITKGPT